MRANISTAFAALKIGMDILVNEENVGIDSVLGHGGIFKTEGVAQSILAAAINADVSVMEGAGEGGPWGMALLAAYMNEKEEGEKLQTYLSNKVFANAKKTTVAPKLADVKGFEEFTKRYAEGISIEKAAIENLLQ
jgi:sugar (pentulose or hexulose) kinase